VFGFTQYFFGAVVFTLNAWSEDVGLCTVKSVAICFFSSTVTRARAYKTSVSVVCVFGQLNSREKKKFPLREKKGTKKNEEKRRAKRPSSSSFSAAKSNNNGTITLHARAKRGREKKWQREREISLSNGDAASLFFPKEEPFFPRGGCALRSLPHASSSQSKRGHDREKRKQRRSETNAHLNGSCSVGVMTNPFSLISFNALVVLCVRDV